MAPAAVVELLGVSVGAAVVVVDEVDDEVDDELDDMLLSDAMMFSGVAIISLTNDVLSLSQSKAV
jgi:hypothetical protein